MTEQLKATAATIQVKVADLDQGAQWYERLLGRPADLRPNDRLHEWEVFANGWIQILEGPLVQNPGRMRFGVTDVAAIHQRIVDEMSVDASEITTVPGLVAFCDFQDPWGNALGLFQDLIQYPLDS